MAVHLNRLLLPQDNFNNLKILCSKNDISFTVKKDIDVLKILKSLSLKKEIFTAEGLVVKKKNENFAFIRYPELSYTSSVFDIHVPSLLVKSNPLITNGRRLKVQVKVKDRNKGEMQLYCDKIIDQPKSFSNQIIDFQGLTPQYPVKQIKLVDSLSSRIIDVISPIGFGQRGLIVAPPKAGKTMLLQSIALEILHHNPESKLIYLMIGERPEECTETRRVLAKAQCNGQVEILSSTFDESPHRHAEISSLALDMAKHLVLEKRNVIILLDSLTRLTRSHNELCASSGRVMTGGIESKALTLSKRFLGAARDTEEAGSLTIISTLLVETGMRMDEVIFEEFKGTGNMEVFLSRKLAERGIYPAIDISKSGTRRSDLFLTQERYQRSQLIKKLLNTRDMDMQNAMELLIKKIKQHPSNEDFFASLNQSVE